MKTRRQRKAFYFKKFAVHHDRCTMKVGTDAVLLGAWATILNTKHVLDVGTGSGVIALMIAQRTNDDVHIDAIEIEKNDANQARENVAGSPWPDKILVYHTSLQEFKSNERYDLIVSNPPYFINSLLPPSQQRTKARHANNLTFEELISHSIRLLKPEGRLAVILPFTEGNILKAIAEKNHLYLIKETAFYSRKGKPQERWLFEFGFEKQPVKSGTLILYKSDQVWSEEYRQLISEFYTNS